MNNLSKPSLSKFEPVSKRNVIINRKPAVHEKSRLLQIKLKPTQVIGESVFTYANIKVEHSGFYHICNQLAIKCNLKSKTHILQFGICELKFDDFSECFNSVMASAACEANDIMSNNLASITYLEANTEYIGWFNFQSDNNANFEFSEEYSNIKSIKI